jgi:hypothetical protein
MQLWLVKLNCSIGKNESPVKCRYLILYKNVLNMAWPKYLEYNKGWPTYLEYNKGWPKYLVYKNKS